MKIEFNFKNWIAAFKENADKADCIQWEEENYKLTSGEKRIIYSSIRQFQRGESGEGKYLYKDAKKFMQQCTNDSYMYALSLFIHEEHRHANYLLKFMDSQHIPKEKEHLIDNIFRWLRHHGNLEVSITVLITAEYIAAVYYKALKKSTQSKCLQQICTRILEDEDLHIRFQSYALSRIQKNRNPLLNFYMRMQHKILLFGTIPVVWFFHRKVLKAGGYNVFTFAMDNLLIYARSNAIIKANDKELLQAEQV